MLKPIFHPLFDQLHGNILSIFCEPGTSVDIWTGGFVESYPSVQYRKENRATNWWVVFSFRYWNYGRTAKFTLSRSCKSRRLWRARPRWSAQRTGYLQGPTARRHSIFTFTNYTCLKCEVCLKGVDQPVKKHQSEIDQQKEAVAILEVLHENSELPGSGQQQVCFLSL